MNVLPTAVTPVGQAPMPQERPGFPAGPPKLPHARLAEVQRETLTAPRLRYSMLAMMLFQVMDLGYGRPGSITKFIVLEYIARLPYQTWEWLGYRVLARQRRRSALATRPSVGSSRLVPSRTTSSGTC
jgi:ubiquinol oxidase